MNTENDDMPALDFILTPITTSSPEVLNASLADRIQAFISSRTV